MSTRDSYSVVLCSGGELVSLGRVEDGAVDGLEDDEGVDGLGLVSGGAGDDARDGGSWCVGPRVCSLSVLSSVCLCMLMLIAPVGMAYLIVATSLSTFSLECRS